MVVGMPGLGEKGRGGKDWDWENGRERAREWQSGALVALSDSGLGMRDTLTFLRRGRSSYVRSSYCVVCTTGNRRHRPIVAGDRDQTPPVLAGCARVSLSEEHACDSRRFKAPGLGFTGAKPGVWTVPRGLVGDDGGKVRA